MQIENYLTERKCRRCGYISEHSTAHDNMDPAEFMQTVKASVNEPLLAFCEICQRDTFQDLVSILIPNRQK
ncbi:MAG TPA: hypothetical protein VMZ69_03275 [Saprospiraceae bacterium]|nr:hypothetical protein [Saprospiraceae bacterium]